MDHTRSTDLVLDGGGVKGLGLVGALAGLQAAHYRFGRIAGSSAGAIIGSLLAAGLDAQAMQDLLTRLDYRKLLDPTWISRLGRVGELASLWLYQGIYKGNYLHQHLNDTLASLGVHTFADLRLTDDWAASLPPEQRYKLVVIVSDVSRGELVRLPWDYHRYGLEPDRQLVADAVRASMALTLVFQPARLGRSWLLDGGYLSDFPITIFDDAPGHRHMHDTIGIKLSARPDLTRVTNPVHSTWDLAKALFLTMQNAHDTQHLEDPGVIRRTIFVDTDGIRATDFQITSRQQTHLYQAGLTAANKFVHPRHPI